MPFRVRMSAASIKLLSEYGSLSSLLEAPMEMLCQSAGIKENSAILLKVVDWIRRHYGLRRIIEENPNSQTQIALFDPASPNGMSTLLGISHTDQKKVTRKHGTGMFGKAMLNEAIHILPALRILLY